MGFITLIINPVFLILCSCCFSFLCVFHWHAFNKSYDVKFPTIENELSHLLKVESIFLYLFYWRLQVECTHWNYNLRCLDDGTKLSYLPRCFFLYFKSRSFILLCNKTLADIKKTYVCMSNSQVTFTVLKKNKNMWRL